MFQKTDFLFFSCAGKRFAIDILHVERVIRAVRVDSIPDAPVMLEGIINLYGKVTAVISLRKRFGLSPKPVEPSDRFVLVNSPDGQFAFIADEVNGLGTVEVDDLIPSSELAAGLEASGILRSRDGIILIYDPGRFFPREDALALSAVLNVS